MALTDTGLVVRYYFDEAASGTSPTAIVDASPNGYDLTEVNYGSGNMAFAEPAAGQRGLASTSTNGTQRARRAIDNTSDAVRDALDGAQKITLEMVLDVDGATVVSSSRTFGINDRVGSTGRFILRAENTAGTLWSLNWNGDNLIFYDLALDLNGRHVVHLVVDTTLATQADRCRAWVDGVEVTAGKSVTVAQNTTLSLGSNVDLIALNRESSGNFDRSLNGKLHYAALYAHAMSAGEVSGANTTLSASDDAPAGGPTYIEGIGASAGVALATGVSGATVLSLGAVAGAAATTGIASALSLSLGAATGAASVSGVSAYVIAAVGSSAGAAATSGAGIAATASVGSAAGVGAATGVGAAHSLALGAAAGAGAATGVGAATIAAVGSSDGVAVVTGAGQDVGSEGSDGVAAGVATVSGVAAAVVRSTGSAAGTAAVSGVGATVAVVASEGASAGAAVVSGVGEAVDTAIEATGSAAGSAQVTGISSAYVPSVGSSAGSASVSGVGDGGVPPVEVAVPPGMPGGRIIPWDRVPQPRTKGRTLADEKRDLAKLFGPKSKKKRPPPDAPSLAPAPAPDGPPAPVEVAVLPRASALTALDTPLPIPARPAVRAKTPEPMEWNEPTVLDDLLMQATEAEAQRLQQEDDDMLMMLALITTLEDE